MAKKSRKSRRGRSRKAQPRKPQTRRQAQPAAPQAPEATARAASLQKTETDTRVATAARPRRTVTQRTVDFVSEYAYVYYDLRKMFTLAAVMFILLMAVNMIITRFLVL